MGLGQACRREAGEQRTCYLPKHQPPTSNDKNVSLSVDRDIYSPAYTFDNLTWWLSYKLGKIDPFVWGSKK